MGMAFYGLNGLNGLNGVNGSYGNYEKSIMDRFSISVAGCSAVEVLAVGVAGSDVLAGSGVPAVWIVAAVRAAAGWSRGLS